MGYIAKKITGWRYVELIGEFAIAVIGLIWGSLVLCWQLCIGYASQKILKKEKQRKVENALSTRSCSQR